MDYFISADYKRKNELFDYSQQTGRKMSIEKITSIVIATSNNNKIKEISRIIGEIGVDWVAGSDFLVGEVEENGSTYAENAEIKARAYSNISGLPALADDSGLEVDALDGLPGIHSNRFFGQSKTDAEKVAELLKRLEGVPQNKRTARFICHAVLLAGNQMLASVRGTVEGFILYQPQGSGGFGYDPVFYYPELRKTFADLSVAEKNIRSHRGQAMRKIREFLLRFGV